MRKPDELFGSGGFIRVDLTIRTIEYCSRMCSQFRRALVRPAFATLGKIDDGALFLKR